MTYHLWEGFRAPPNIKPDPFPYLINRLFVLFISTDVIMVGPQGEQKMNLRIKVYAKDLSVLKLLTLILERKGHQVHGVTDNYCCPSCSLNMCPCPPGTTCADAVIINTRKPVLETLPILEEQDKNGCKLKKQQKVLMSSFFTDEQKQTIQSLGYPIIKKPFSLSTITKWLEAVEHHLASG